MSELLQINHRHVIDYDEDPENWVGVEDGSAAVTAIRTSTVVPYNAATHKCVRKFGQPYVLTDVTNAVIVTPRSAAGNSWNFKFYDIDTDTLLGTVTDSGGASAFVDGAVLGVASTGIYMVMTWVGGAGPSGPTNGDTITLTTDTHPGGLVVRLSGESISAGTITWALSATGSTYYAETSHDQTMRHGGNRHTPTGTSALPYFTITAAWISLGGAFVVVHVLDSATYDEALTSAVAGAGITVQAANGQHPVITRGVGARASREVTAVFNNSNAIYWNDSGLNANPGTWQLPKQTSTNALAAVTAARPNCIYGGLGAVDNPIVYIVVSLIPPLVIVSNFEPEYGRVPTIIETGAASIYMPSVNGDMVNGFILKHDGDSSAWNGIDSTVTGAANDCTVIRGLWGIYYGVAGVVSVNRCLVYSQSNRGIYLSVNAGSTISNCIAKSGVDGIYIEQLTNGEILCDQCLVYDNSGIGISYLVMGITLTGICMNCTAFNNGNSGFAVAKDGGTVFNGGILHCISHSNGTYGYSGAGAGANVPLYYCNAYLNGTAATIGATHTAFNGNDGADARTVDPHLIKVTNPYILAPSANSTVTKLPAPAIEIDCGYCPTNIDITLDDITINGFEITGNDEIVHAIEQSGNADREGLIVRYCTIHNYLGVAVDYYCDGAANPTDGFLQYNEIYDNGCGMKLWAGNNRIEENIFYTNVGYNFYTIYPAVMIDHIVSYGCPGYGIYFGAFASGTYVKNSVSDGNGLYGMYGAVYIPVYYSDVTDQVNANIDLTDPTNLVDVPFFRNTNDGVEDFHLRTIEGGYPFNSTLRDAGDDGEDIGAWLMNRSVADESWRKFVPTDNPRKLNPGVDIMQTAQQRTSVGTLAMTGGGGKRNFILEWNPDQYAAEADRKTLEYFAQLVQTRENLKSREAVKLWFIPLPTTHIKSGATGLVDVTARTLTDISRYHVEDELKGYWTVIVWTSGTGAVIDAAAKTCTKAAAGWAVDEWIGTYIKQNGYWFRVLSNTATVLTLSDPDGRLTNDAAFAYSIFNFFEVETNDIQVQTLKDPEGKLRAGTYAWYVEFAVCIVRKASFGYKQLGGYNWAREVDKTGFKLELEQI